MAEPFVRPMDYASPGEKRENHGHPSEIKEEHPQIDPTSNASERGEVKKTPKEEKLEQKSRLNWRIVFIIMAVIFTLVALYFLIKLGGAAFNAIFGGDNRATEQRISVETDPRLRSTVSDTQLKPNERVDSNLNVVPLEVPYGPSRVLGASTTERMVAPDTGPRDYRPYYNPYATEPTRCSDYMGNRYACVQPYYTDYGTVGAPREYNSYPSTPTCTDYMGNRYSCVSSPSSTYQNTPYYEDRGTYDYYYRSTPYYQYGSGRCSDYMGNRYACVQPYYTDYGPVR
jgi:hypothetical protein